jgi:hypothetical protein
MNLSWGEQVFYAVTLTIAVGALVISSILIVIRVCTRSKDMDDDD